MSRNLIHDIDLEEIEDDESLVIKKVEPIRKKDKLEKEEAPRKKKGHYWKQKENKE